MKNKKKKYWYRTWTPQDAIFFFFTSKKKRKREYFRYQKYYEKYYGYPSKKSYKSFCYLMIWRSFLAFIFTLFFPITMWFDIVGILYSIWSKHTLSPDDQVLLEEELRELWRKEDEAEKQKKMLEKKKKMLEKKK